MNETESPGWKVLGSFGFFVMFSRIRILVRAVDVKPLSNPLQ